VFILISFAAWSRANRMETGGTVPPAHAADANLLS
jgi:hypothetical protein